MVTLARGLIRRAGFDITRWPRESITVHLEELFKRLRVDVVVDVGAHHGEWAKLVRRFYHGPVISFEPVTLEQLRGAASSDDQWEVRPYALGAERGQREINVAHETVYSSFRRGLTALPVSVSHRQSVEVRTLDESVGAADRHLFLKLDTQGWDLEVLSGAQRTLPNIAGVQIETAVRPLYEDSPLWFETIPRLNELGFQLTGIFPAARDDRLRIVDLDCVLARV